MSGCSTPSNQPAYSAQQEEKLTLTRAYEEAETLPEPVDPADQTDVPAEEALQQDPRTVNVQKPVLCIEAGHQSSGNSDKEPIAPGSSVMKPKVSSGTRGVSTGKPEYELNLEIALKLQNELASDYQVVMVRTTNDVDLSNKERAEFCSRSGADLMIRLHADGSENPKTHGMSLLYPSPDSPYTKEISAESLAAASFLRDGLVETTSAAFNGFKPREDLTGFNWLTIPSVLIEAGFMTNPDEDRKLSQDAYQNQIVTGIKKGLDSYYASKSSKPEHGP
ncbi:N-acetylmuramoyl-L-alanine amidase [Saccharibacillus sp. O23]|nr:N-acetylmuramoyl-L-alanine amidase [Saccharibacillus sp. O23]